MRFEKILEKQTRLIAIRSRLNCFDVVLIFVVVVVVVVFVVLIDVVFVVVVVLNVNVVVKVTLNVHLRPPVIDVEFGWGSWGWWGWWCVNPFSCQTQLR